MNRQLETYAAGAADLSRLKPEDWGAATLSPIGEHTLKARILVGAAHAYACLSDDTAGAAYSMDIQLHGACSAPDSLRRTAAEWRDKAARFELMAQRAEQAATILGAEKSNA